MERRLYPRRSISRALRIDTETRRDLMGITRNVSARGIQFHGADPFVLGERLALKVYDEGCAAIDSIAIGNVVRTERYGDDPSIVFPHVTAVQLESPLPKRIVGAGPR